MSTNANYEETAARQVEKGRQTAAWGHTDEALAHYRNVWESHPDLADEGLVFQKIRSLVNAGVLTGRQGDLSQAEVLFDRAVGLASAWPLSGRIQGAALRSRINEVLLLEESSRRSTCFEALCREYVLSNHGEVHRQLIGLFDPEPMAFVETVPGDLNLDGTNPATTWLGKALFSSPPAVLPSPEDFFRLYSALPLGYKKGLHQNFPGIMKKFDPQGWLGPLFRFENYKKTDSSGCNGHRLAAAFSPPAPRSAVRGLQPWGEGWTWWTENGRVYFWKKELQEIRCFEEGVAQAHWHGERQEWALVSQMALDRVVLVNGEATRDINLPGPVELLSAGPKDWVWVADQGRWGTFDRVVQEESPLTETGPWTGGTCSGSHLYLWGTGGKILCRERTSQGRTWIVPAHRGRILSSVVRESGLVTGGEDGRILFWMTDKDRGLKSVGEKRTDGPVFFAEQSLSSGHTALAGGRTLWSFTSRREQETRLAQEVQGLCLNSEGQVLWSDKKNQVQGPFGGLRAHGNWAVSLGWNPRRKTWASGCLDGMVCEWDSQGILRRRSGWEGGRTVVGGRDFFAVIHQSWVTVKNLEGKELTRLDLGGEPLLSWSWNEHRDKVWLFGLGGRLASFEVPSGRLLLTLDHGGPVVGLLERDRQLFTWDYTGVYREFSPAALKSGKPDRTVNWAKGRLGGAFWNRDAQALVWGTDGKTLLTFDQKTGVFPFSLEGVHRRGLNDALWEGTRLWTAGQDGRLVVWNMEKPEVETVLWDTKEEVCQILGMRRGVVVRTAGKNWLLCHRSEYGGGVCEVTEIPGHRGRLTAMAMKPGEEVLVTAGEDRTLRFFSLPDGQFMEKLTLEVPAIGLSFSPEGEYLVYLDREGTVGTVVQKDLN